eukprot:GHVN01003036.1.p1 GENE.GHVN01003036.1~~GHVN01003036.1.p1  ORF type:complete len:230 (+),score=21.39 GHVN01003036.1:466-1155(+)
MQKWTFLVGCHPRFGFVQVRQNRRLKVSSVPDGVTAESDEFGLIERVTGAYVPLKDDPNIPMIYTIVEAADAEHGFDIVAHRVKFSGCLTADYVVIVSVHTFFQLDSVLNTIENEVEKRHHTVIDARDGISSSGWVVVGYEAKVPIRIHVATPQLRKFYSLDTLVENPEVIKISHIVSSVDYGKDDEGWQRFGQTSHEEQSFKDAHAGDSLPQSLKWDIKHKDEDPFWS